MSTMLLISNSVPQVEKSRRERNALSTLVIPAGLFSLDDGASLDVIWWVEKYRSGYYLRAKAQVASTQVDRDPVTKQTFILCSLSSAERISWSGTTGRSTLVTHVLSNLYIASYVAPALIPLSKDMDEALEQVRVKAPRNAWSFADAVFKLDEVIERASALLSDGSWPNLSRSQVWLNFQLYFARNELVQLMGRDPYDLAADIYCQQSEAAPLASRLKNQNLRQTEPNRSTFRELNEERIGTSEMAMVISTSKSTKLVDNTNKHQTILKELAREVRRIGLKPSFSRHIDMIIQTPQEDIMFEVKTTTPENFREQLRDAVGQLLEYRFLYYSKLVKPARLVAVLEVRDWGTHESYAEAFLTSLGISAIFWEPVDSSFHGLKGILAPV